MFCEVFTVTVFPALVSPVENVNGVSGVGPLLIAVTRPLAFTVTLALVKEPVLVLTVASVRAFVLFPVPSNELPALVTSPVVVPIVRAVVSFGADMTVRTGVVVGVATVKSEVEDDTLVTVPVPLAVLFIVIPPTPSSAIVTLLPCFRFKID